MPIREQNDIAKALADYFELIKTSSVHIPNANYVAMGAEELAMKGVNLNFGGQLGMIYEPPDFSISGKNLRDATLRAEIGLWFVQFAAKDDFAARLLVEQNAYRVAMQFLARMKKDQEDYLKGESSLAITNRFDLSNVNLNLTGRIGDYHFGYVLEFALQNDGHITYTSDDWT